MRRAATVVAIVTVLAGCGGDGSHRATTAAPSATATKTTPAPPAPRSQTVQFKATDGETVTGDYTPAGRGAPALVLLHENRFSREQWEPLVPYLHAAGFATLAYDSRASLVEDKRLPDALGAVRWLRARRDVDRRRIGLVGADIGGSTAVLAAITGARRDVRAVVALSPDSSKTIADRQQSGDYGAHDLLVVSNAHEWSIAAALLKGAVRSKGLRSASRGVAVLDEPGVRDAVLSWLDQRVRR